MMEVFNGGLCISNATRCERWTVDPLDSIWLGMKLGVAMIGMVMMLSLWRGRWRSKAREQKNK
jgi:Na+-driven multidrug efflux pump